MKEINVVAVVVTHNRFELLKEAIAALQKQTAAYSKLVVINNGSTDGTAQWLDSQSDLYVVHQENVGASGGFAKGIKIATSLGADYVWMMDDDTICESTTLEKLLEKINLVDKPIGFIGSHCKWIDGEPHLMNIPMVRPLFNNQLPFNLYNRHKLVLAESSSFVSLFVNCQAVKDVGLPYKEFFIWGDDQEFTSRITKKGYLGFYCADSIVLHKTAENTFTNFYIDQVKNIWKHQHGFRNEFFLVKRNKGLLYFSLWLPAKLLYASVKVFKMRKKDHGKFIKALWKAGWASLSFNPKIDMIDTPTQMKTTSEIPVLHTV